MGHQAEHVAGGIGQSRHIPDRSIGVSGITEYHLTLLLQPVQLLGLHLIPALPVGDRQGDALSLCVVLQPAAAARIHDQFRRLAEEMQAAVAGERPRQQTHLGEHLEAVADAEHGAPCCREASQLLEHGREAGDGAAAQVVAVAEATGKNDGLEAAEIAFLMPEKTGGAPQAALEGPAHVPVAVGAREHHDADGHRSSPQPASARSRLQSSITGLASRRSLSSSRRWRAAA